MERAIEGMRHCGIDRIICLTPDDEIRAKSPGYAAVLEENVMPCPVQRFPIPDFEVPEDRHAFLSLVQQLRDSLREGERLMVHCSAGIGRTGTVATCLLVALGFEPSTAREAVQRAGSRPEHDLIHWVTQEGR
jgi:protein-tyrosine phosphatase